MEDVGEEHTSCFPHRSKHAGQRTWGCWQRIQFQNVETLEDFRDEVEMSGLDEDGKKEVYKILKEKLDHEAQLLVAEEMFLYSSAMENDRFKGEPCTSMCSGFPIPGEDSVPDQQTSKGAIQAVC